MQAYLFIFCIKLLSFLPNSDLFLRLRLLNVLKIIFVFKIRMLWHEEQFSSESAKEASFKQYIFCSPLICRARTTDTRWQHKSKITDKLSRCGRLNMLPPYLKIWDWDWVFGRAVKAIFSLGVRSPWVNPSALITMAGWGIFVQKIFAFLKVLTKSKIAEIVLELFHHIRVWWKA